MATTYNNAQIGIVDSSGNVNVIYPITTGANVAITANSNYTSGTTVQKLVSGLGAAAFKSVETDYTKNTSNAVASAGALYNAVTAINSNLEAIDNSVNVVVNESLTEVNEKIDNIVVGKIPVNPSDTSDINIWIES